MATDDRTAPEDRMAPADRALCAATASLLHSYAAVAALGLPLSAVALIALALTAASLSIVTGAGYGAVVALGVVERGFWLRLGFDAGLFGDMASGAIESPSTLDRTLHRLGLRAMPHVPRDLDDRVAGTRRLVRWHALLVVAQCAMMMLALTMAAWR
ncbi:MAG: hypothetical protein ABIW85_00795 [Variovorax sp.]